MKQFSWADVVTEKICPKCLAVMEEKNALLREVKFLNGNLASVRWTCKACDFRISGTYNFEGEEESGLVDDHIVSRIREAKDRERLQEADYAARKPKLALPRKPVLEPKVFDSDDAAMAAVYPDAVSKDDLLNIIQNVFDERLEFKDKAIERKITPESVKMGERGSLDGYNVSYMLDEVEVYSNTFFAEDGIPSDIEDEAKKVGKALESLVRGRVSLPEPKQPRGFRGRAVRIDSEVQRVDIVKSRGMPAVGDGVRG